MSETMLQHVSFSSTTEYVEALNTLCGLAKHTLQIFEKDFDNQGFNNVTRFEILRKFLLGNPNNRLQLLAHDTRPISQFCPRMMLLLRQFGHSMFIYQTPINMKHLTAPFAVADESHSVRRFHFDDTRGILALNDGEGARVLKSRFMEIWETSRPNTSTTTFTL